MADRREVRALHRVVDRDPLREQLLRAVHAEDERAHYPFDALLVDRRNTEIAVTREHVGDVRPAEDDLVVAEAQCRGKIARGETRTETDKAG